MTNPTGARATTYDHHINTFGADAHGFARRPLDNVVSSTGFIYVDVGKYKKDNDGNDDQTR